MPCQLSIYKLSLDGLQIRVKIDFNICSLTKVQTPTCGTYVIVLHYIDQMDEQSIDMQRSKLHVVIGHILLQ